jgi:hypothetical protein
MNKIDPVQIPINIIDHFLDDIIISFVNSFFQLVLLGLIIFCAERNLTVFVIIFSILFFLVFIISPGITYYYSNAKFIISTDGCKIIKYGNEILFIPFNNLIRIDVKKTEMKSNTFFDVFIYFKEFQIVDFSTTKTIKFKVEKKNFMSANQYYDSVVEYFNLKLQLPEVWPQNIYK